MHESSFPIECDMKARWEEIKITMGRKETQFQDKVCKCFSRNPAQVNDLNGLASSTSVWA